MLAHAAGHDVALRQPLYTAFFADRIEVPVTAGVRVMPRTDDAAEKPAAIPKPTNATRFMIF